MNADYVVKTIPAVRLVGRTATIDMAEIGERVGPMFGEVAAALHLGPVSSATPMTTYDSTEAGMRVGVGYAYDGPAPDGLEEVTLPETQAVCGVHLGAMETIGESWQGLHRWIVENGYSFSGPSREVYVRADSQDQSDWVTELQQPVTR